MQFVKEPGGLRKRQAGQLGRSMGGNIVSGVKGQVAEEMLLRDGQVMVGQPERGGDVAVVIVLRAVVSNFVFVSVIRHGIAKVV